MELWLKWTWDFAIYSKFLVYSCKHDSKQRKIEKAIRLIAEVTGVTGGYKGLQGVTKGLQKVKKGYRKCHRVTRDYRG